MIKSTRSIVSEAFFSRRAFLTAMASAGAVLLPQNGWTDTRPNILYILTDDQGSRDVGCYGAADLHTPHLDGLAARGVRFDQFYSAAPVCSPSRAALLTGRYPQCAGMMTNASGDLGLPPSEITIAEVLRAAGYRTGCFGKWHLGEPAAMGPLAQGFDVFYGHKVGCIDNYSHFFYWGGPNRHDMWRDDTETHEDQGVFFTDIMTRETARFLDQRDERPFFLYLPFNLPHYPVQPNAADLAVYPPDMPEPRRAYAAFVTAMDRRIGEILAMLEARGLRENTLVIFMSDNGHSVEERNHFGGGYTGGLRGHKFNLWEGGIRVPCIASWPGRLPEGVVREQPAIAMDWLPTIAHYTGAALPETSLDGVNLAPVIESSAAASPHDELHWEWGHQWAVREGSWKLVRTEPNASPESGAGPAGDFLCALDTDPAESINLAGEHPDIVARLTASHQVWRARWAGAP